MREDLQQWCASAIRETTILHQFEAEALFDSGPGRRSSTAVIVFC
jgi:hypothetical protein